jgi:hypothetical protein
MPALLVWQKIEPAPFGDDVTEALRCEVRDGLWLLARQWQLRELEAEDAGTAAGAHLLAHSSPLQQVMVAGVSATPLLNDVPLNALVESVAPAFDLTLRMESGREWLRMLLAAGKREAREKFRRSSVLHFLMREPEYAPDDPDLPHLIHEPYVQTLAAIGSGRMIDGGRLLELLSRESASTFLDTPDSEVDALANQWLTWVRRLVEPNSNAPSAWNPAHLTYRFDSAAAALEGNSAHCLKTSAHDGRTLDWFGFEHAQCSGELASNINVALLAQHRRTVIPSPVSFPGMPRARWWEMEDEGINFTNIRAAKTDTGALVLTEFSLLFSNDWLLVSLPLPLGCLVQVLRIEVTDVFGVQSSIPSAYSQEESALWEIFRMSPAGGHGGSLLLPPTHDRWVQGAPVEEVQFIRDEMANVVWAVERTVSDGLGEGKEGAATALHLERRLRELAGAPDTAPPALQQNDANLRYALATDVPSHWIPFIPVRPDAEKPDIVLRRAAMPRLIEGKNASRLRPRTQLLRAPATNGNHYDLREEEIPANGLSVRAVWRRVRWYDGQTVTWFAYERRPSANLTSSGLQFDQVLDRPLKV